MELRIPRPILADMQAHAQETYPQECCGFLIGRKDGDARLVELVFQIDKTTLIRRQRQDPPAAKGGRS